MKHLFIYLIFSTILTLSCSDSNSNISDEVGIPNPNETNNNGPWLIDKRLIFDGGPGKNGIPALINPELISAESANYLSDDDLVVGLKYGNTVIAYPHKILDWHEIINVDVSDLSLGIIYCPLTGTAIGWNRNINNINTTFGVSGLLYKNNIVPYDRETGSNWSQLKLECVNGNLIGKKPEVTILTEMKWGVWRKIYNQTIVVSTNTGHNRDYDNYPYGSYKTNNQYFIFPVNQLTKNIPAKERVHAIIINNTAKVYRFGNFVSGKVFIDTFENKKILMVGNEDFIVSFELNDNTNDLDFTYSFNDTEIILSDNEGNNWNIFGEAITGSRKGDFLDSAKNSMMAYYFSIENFYPDVLIYE